MNNLKLSYFSLGEVLAEGYLKTQLELQRRNITNYMELYDEYSEKSGWLGGDGESWERGPYYVRGLVALAYTLNDSVLIEKAKKWINYSIESQQPDGNFGSKKILSKKLSEKTEDECADEWWARMPMLMAIADYYDAECAMGNEDLRVLNFFEKYFRFELNNLKKYRLKGWAKYRGADNVVSIIWYKNKCLEQGKNDKVLQWLDELAELIISQSFDWSNSLEKTYTREHVVNTTQGYKYPFIKYLLNGDKSELNKLKIGLSRIGNDHGRIDKLPNADEAAKDNRAINGTETCAVVEGMLSLEIAGQISPEGYIYDLLESYCYNNMPNCFDYNLTAYNYYQVENCVLMTHGQHGFVNDHGDSNALGIGGFECCFSNLHMGYPKFVQSMWAREKDDKSIVLLCYGSNSLNTVIDGKRIIFKQVTDYPYKDKVSLKYLGENTKLKLKLRIPLWTKKFDVCCNENKIDYQLEGNFAVIEYDFICGDELKIKFYSEIEIVDFHNNSMFVRKGAVIYCNPIKEDWREITDYSYRGVKYSPKGSSKNWEIYPNEDWNFTFDKNEHMKFKVNKQYDNSKPSTPYNYPCSIELDMKKAENWQLEGNNAATIYSANCFEKSVKRKLIPTAFSRLKISVFPKIGGSVEFFKKDNSEILKYINSNLKNVPVVNSKIDIAYAAAQLTFKVNENANYKYYIIFGTEKGVYTDISEQISENAYIYCGDPYGARIEYDKSAVSLDNSKKYYLRIAYMLDGKLKKISEELIFNNKEN